jgi:hypothetical protein
MLFSCIGALLYLWFGDIHRFSWIPGPVLDLVNDEPAQGVSIVSFVFTLALCFVGLICRAGRVIPMMFSAGVFLLLAITSDDLRGSRSVIDFIVLGMGGVLLAWFIALLIEVLVLAVSSSRFPEDHG